VSGSRQLEEKAVYDSQELAMRQSIGRVLRTHPDGQSLFGEADHYRVLAEQSAVAVTRAFTSMQETRLGYEELRHRLDPRHARTIHLGVGLTLLAAIFTSLVLLNAIELSGVVTGWMTAAAVAATVAWIGCSWLSALAQNEKNGRLLAVITAGAVVTGFLLAALHSEGIASRADIWHRFGFGGLVALLIIVLVEIAAVLITRTEPASLIFARRRWHHSQDQYATAVRTHRGDAEAAVIAAQGWRSLIEAEANASAADEKQARITQQP